MRQMPLRRSIASKLGDSTAARASGESASRRAAQGLGERRGQETLLRLPAVIGRVGLKKSTIYKKMGRHEFPRPVPIGKRARAWRASEIEQWIAQRG